MKQELVCLTPAPLKETSTNNIPILTGLLFMWGTHLYICGVDAEGYERAMRAFPLRTGVANPEWVVVGADADKWSTGGILGAGYGPSSSTWIDLTLRSCSFWDHDGMFSNEMSWLG